MMVENINSRYDKVSGPVVKLMVCGSCGSIWGRPVHPILWAGDKCMECDLSDDHPDRLRQLEADMKAIAKTALFKKYYAEHPEEMRCE